VTAAELRARATTAAAPVLAIVLAVVLALAGTGAAQRASLAERGGWPPEVDTVYLPGARALGLLSLGHREMAADLVAARANVYFGAELAAQGRQRWLKRYLDTAVALDPRFHRLYLRGAAMLVYNGNDISVSALEAANDLLARGARRFPADWELPFQLGFNMLFELPKLVPAGDPRLPAWRRQGVEALRQAALLDGAPAWLPGLVARLLAEQQDGQAGGSAAQELALLHLEQTFAVTSSAPMRAEIARKITALRGRRRAADLEADAAALERLVGERYPYAPEAFSVVAGPRR
jgi:hypothetical protein